mmetsp:Transcript_18706/g.61409  ORF Transcript_18706/g.61409 Transcript_18706/m.61409 type:complete len:425 (+) Transcript_18706:932-2206(+)
MHGPADPRVLPPAPAFSWQVGEHLAPMPFLPLVEVHALAMVRELHLPSRVSDVQLRDHRCVSPVPCGGPLARVVHVQDDVTVLPSHTPVDAIELQPVLALDGPVSLFQPPSVGEREFGEADDLDDVAWPLVDLIQECLHVVGIELPRALRFRHPVCQGKGQVVSSLVFTSTFRVQTDIKIVFQYILGPRIPNHFPFVLSSDGETEQSIVILSLKRFLKVNKVRARMFAGLPAFLHDSVASPRTCLRFREPVALQHLRSYKRIVCEGPVRNLAVGPDLPHGHPERPHIALLRVLPPPDALRRHPPYRPSCRPCCADARSLTLSLPSGGDDGKPVVSDLDADTEMIAHVEAEDKHVPRCQVSMHNVMQRELYHPVADLLRHLQLHKQADSFLLLGELGQHDIERTLGRELCDEAAVARGRIDGDSE